MFQRPAVVGARRVPESQSLAGASFSVPPVLADGLTTLVDRRVEAAAPLEDVEPPLVAACRRCSPPHAASPASAPPAASAISRSVLPCPSSSTGPRRTTAGRCRSACAMGPQWSPAGQRLRVQRVAQAVAEQVEGQHRDEQRRARDEQVQRVDVCRTAPSRRASCPRSAVGGSRRRRGTTAPPRGRCTSGSAARRRRGSAPTGSGSISRMRIRGCWRPRCARPRRTRFSRSDSTWPRMMRPRYGQPKKPMMKIRTTTRQGVAGHPERVEQLHDDQQRDRRTAASGRRGTGP